MVPAPSSAKPRARAGAVRRALPHRLASTRNAAATMATGKLAVWLVKADAADVEIALHCAAAAKHGYIALTASAHIMQEQKILKNLVQDARKAGGLCGSQARAEVQPRAHDGAASSLTAQARSFHALNE